MLENKNYTKVLTMFSRLSMLCWLCFLFLTFLWIKLKFLFDIVKELTTCQKGKQIKKNVKINQIWENKLDNILTYKKRRFWNVLSMYITSANRLRNVRKMSGIFLLQNQYEDTKKLSAIHNIQKTSAWDIFLKKTSRCPLTVFLSRVTNKSTHYNQTSWYDICNLSKSLQCIYLYTI